MSLQAIIDTASAIEIARNRIMSTSISRSQRVKVSERNAAQPWLWRVTPAAGLRWSSSRAIIEELDFKDRIDEYTITVASRTNLHYLFRYQSDLTDLQLSNLFITAWTATSVTLGGLPAPGTPDRNNNNVGSNTVLFRPGDYIQPLNSRYPYTTINTVTRGGGNTVSFFVNRPLITSEGISVVGQQLRVGVDVRWQFIILNRPNYRIIPYDRVEFTGDFELLERVI